MGIVIPLISAIIFGGGLGKNLGVLGVVGVIGDERSLRLPGPRLLEEKAGEIYEELVEEIIEGARLEWVVRTEALEPIFLRENKPMVD